MRQVAGERKIKASNLPFRAHLDFLCLSVPRDEMPAAFAAHRREI